VAVQTTLLGLAIALIIALVAALVGPHFIDWNQFRPQFEAEASRIVGAPVRVAGALDARLLPTPSLRLRSVVVGGANDLGKVRADKLDVEFSLGELMRGEWRATQLTIDGAALDLGLDARGRIDLPASNGPFNLGSLAIDRLNLTGRVALHDALSRSTLELTDIVFRGDVRALAGSVRGDGGFTLAGIRYPFRVSSGQAADGNGTRLHLSIEPDQRPLAVDLDGVLSFDARAPRFEGAVVLARPAGHKTRGEPPPTPWRITAKLKADHASARLDGLEASYGTEDNALKLSGLADIRLGASPLLHAVLSARQLDADRLLAPDTAKDNAKDTTKDAAKDTAAEPARLLPALRMLIAANPRPPIRAQIEVSTDQIMLGGRPVQNVAADLRSDTGSWNIDSLEFRAPGSTQVVLSGEAAQDGRSGAFKGALSVESADPDAFAAWLQGRSEISFRSQKPLRVRGSLGISADRVALDGIKAEVNGEALEGRFAYAEAGAAGGSRLEAALKADRLDLDAAATLVRSLAGPQAEWPDQGQLSLDVGRAVASGQEMRPLRLQLGFAPRSIALDQLKIGGADRVAVDGSGSFDRTEATGKLTLNAVSASPKQLTDLIAPLAPALAGRLNTVAGGSGAVHLKLGLDLGKDAGHADRARALAVLDVDAPQISGEATVTATPAVAAMRALDLDALSRGEMSVSTKLSAGQGAALLALLGLDKTVVAGDGPARLEGTASGAWHAPLRVKAKLTGTDLEADAEGSAEPWAGEPKALIDLTVRHANLAPLFDLKPQDAYAQNISLRSRLNWAGSKLALDDMDSVIAGSRIRGHLALTLADPKTIDGQLGLDTLDLAPAFAVAIGSAGHEATDPLGGGLLAGWRGQLTFETLRGSLPGGAEVRTLSGVVRCDGQSLRFDNIKGAIGGGQATADVEARSTAAGIALNARVGLAGVDGAALHYRALALPPAKTSMRMTLTSQGRSVSALSGALSGNGLLTLEAARIPGLDARAFDVAIRASDSGAATDDAKLRQIVEPVLAKGTLAVKSAQIPFTVESGRLRVGATTLDGDGARVVVSGGYDLGADQADLRATLTSSSTGSATSRPEIQLFATGSPDALAKSIDVASLSSWLAVRAIDRETRRLDSLERGETPQVVIPDAMVPGQPAEPDTTASPSDQPSTDVPVPGRDPRRVAPKPKTAVLPRPAPPPPPPSSAPVISQQVVPLPPPVDVRTPPGAVRPPPPPPPKPRGPLVLTPQIAN
jgi:large subunit ribosomal protein L24